MNANVENYAPKWMKRTSSTLFWDGLHLPHIHILSGARLSWIWASSFFYLEILVLVLLIHNLLTISICSPHRNVRSPTDKCCATAVPLQILRYFFLPVLPLHECAILYKFAVLLLTVECQSKSIDQIDVAAYCQSAKWKCVTRDNEFVYLHFRIHIGSIHRFIRTVARHS